METSRIAFKQFRTEGGCLSYIMGDRARGTAFLLDPAAGLEDSYEEFLDAHGLKLTLVLDSHTHADHYSSSHEFARKYGVPIAMSGRTRSQRRTHELREGEILEIGEALSLKVLETPGHTPDSVSFLLRAGAREAVLTGDTLLIGGSGRTDFPGSSPEEQFVSLSQVLGSLGDKTWVFPGHDYSNQLFSSIGAEKSLNPHMRFASATEFAEAKRRDLLDAVSAPAEIIEFNLSANPAGAAITGAFTQCHSGCSAQGDESDVRVLRTPEELRQVLAERPSNALFIDVREESEYRFGHIPGMRNIPASELFLHWEELSTAGEIYFSCQTRNRSRRALETARRLGLKNLVEFSPGFSGWLRSGQKIER